MTNGRPLLKKKWQNWTKESNSYERIFAWPLGQKSCPGLGLGLSGYGLPGLAKGRGPGGLWKGRKDLYGVYRHWIRNFPSQKKSATGSKGFLPWPPMVTFPALSLDPFTRVPASTFVSQGWIVIPAPGPMGPALLGPSRQLWGLTSTPVPTMSWGLSSFSGPCLVGWFVASCVPLAWFKTCSTRSLQRK